MDEREAIRLRAQARRRRAEAQGGNSRDSLMGRIDAGVRGAADMLSFGFADELAAGLGTGFGMLGDYDQALQQQRQIDASDSEDRFGYRLGGQIMGGLAGASGLARAGMSPSVNAIQSGQSLGRVAGASALEGGVLGAAHGFGSGEGLEDRATGALTSGAMGFGIGAAAPVAISGASNVARRALSPFQASPERVAAAQTLRSEGVPVTAGQLTGNRRLRFAESEIGGNRAAQVMGDQQDAFTSAVLRRAGVNSNRATPEVIDRAFTNIGQQFDDLAANNRLVPDPQFSQSLQTVVDDYQMAVPPSMRAPLVENLASDINDIVQQGQAIPGSTYQNLTSRIAKAARGAANPDLRNTLYGIRETLDDAMERSIAVSNPSDAGAWQAAREQYRNLLAVEQSATRAGEAAAEGIISPANIRNAAINQGRRAYARGQGDFADLARSGSMLLAPLPDSGTAGRLNARNMGTSMMSLLGAGAGGAAAGGPGAVAGMVAGAAVPKVAGALMMSRPGQAFLGNQMFAGPMSDNSRSIANLLLNSGAAGYEGRNRTIEQLLLSP